MRLSQTTVLTLVVSLALAGGLASFLVATPDQGRRPAGADLGFARFSEQQVLGDLRNAEEYHRARQREGIVLRAASRAAAAWLGTVAGSGDEAKPTPGSVRVSAAAMPFVRWADDVPRAAWKATVSSVEPAEQDDAGQPARYVVTAFVEVTLASAADRTRRQRVPVSMTIDAASGATQSVVPGAWLISGLEVSGDARFLRAFADPVIERRGTAVDVIAPMTERLLARRLADEAARQLPQLTGRYRAVAGPGVVAVWVLPGATKSRAVLGRSAPADTTVAAPADLHGAAWTDPSGDVVVDAARMRRLAPDSQLLAVRHALAHVATRPADDEMPAVLEEGIALYESRRLATPDDPLAGTDVARLTDAFGTATTGLASLLVARPKLPLDTGAASTDQLAALATVAWIEDVKGHASLVRLLSSLDRGTPAARALRDTLALDARGVELAVARWTRAQGQRETDADAGTPVGDPGEPTRQEQDQ